MAREQESTSPENVEESRNIQITKPQQQVTRPLARAPRSALAGPEWSSPFTVMRRLMDEMDRVFSGFDIGAPSLFTPLAPPVSPLEMIGREFWVPAIETFERDGKLVLRTDLPGLRREDVRVEIVGDELVVSGERTQKEEETRGGRLYSERRYGSFERRLTLPAGVEPDSIEANFDNGVLEISLAVPGRETRKIEVKSRPEKTEEGGQSGSIH